MFKDQEKLIKALVAKEVISEKMAEDIKKDFDAGKGTPESILIDKNLVKEDQIAKVKADLLNMPFADLRLREVDQQILNLIPREVSENYQMVAFEKDKNILSIGLVDPQNFKAIEAAEFLAQKSKFSVQYFLISLSGFRDIYKQYQGLGEEVEEALEDVGESAFKEVTLAGSDMEQVIKSAPVSKMVLVIIRHAIDGRASDIHIEPSNKETRVRYRIDGVLKTSLVLPKYIHSAVVARIKVLANLKLDEARKPQDGRIRLTIEGRDIDFRVSTLPLFEGEKVVLRVLDTASAVPDLEKLGLNKHHIEVIKREIAKPHGLFLVTGPTGSGKTTTLYTILMKLNQEGANIVTLEDPIEYYITGINQSQVKSEIGYTFASGLRSILRQDPNVIMLGEIRDKETAQLVIHASLTGHMVFTTLHTNSAVGAIPRMIDMGAERFLLSSVINLIMAQRLARRICKHCKVEAKVPKDKIEMAKTEVDALPEKFKADVDYNNLKFYKGEGCSRCGNTGYKGRVAVSELIKVNTSMRDIISRGGSRKAMEDELQRQDFVTLTQDGMVKALNGETTLDEVIRISKL